MTLTRRHLLRGAAGALALPFAGPLRAAGRDARVLVIGGGFAGATAARYLARWSPRTRVTLVTSPERYWTCPFSNTAIAGLRSVDRLEVDYGALAADPGVELIRAEVTELDPVLRRARLADGRVLEADRIIVAPGIDLDGARIDGYDAAAAQRFPHAWEAGPATALLRKRLEAVPEGGLVIVTAPDNPYRCPPGPYERASLMAWWLQQHRPRARLLILDAKDAFTKDALFRAEWQARYPNLAWSGRSDGATLRRVDARAGTLHTDFEDHAPDLACVIPPQRAARLARDAGLDGGRGWCPVEPLAFESTLMAGVHVIGDAAIANPMPKSAFAANSQGKACAAALAHLIEGLPAPAPVLMNTCYSLVAPDAAISIAGAYGVRDGALETLEGTAGVSPAEGGGVRAAEADHAHGWYESIVADAFG
ncbi:MAG TPA: NAD(P)/FAD-dependent oxidoreductase [Pseudomonadales bacterium]|nr:NAD(P)/FAD-dependent oxidoreductase [Pseudomonadales bacterium]